MSRRMHPPSTVLIFSFAALMLASRSSAAQESLDLGQYEKALQESGFVTVDELEKREKEARSLYDSGACEKAVPALQDYSQGANTVSNLITATLEPFYDADRDDRGIVSSNTNLFKTLLRVESFANGLKQKRNAAWVMEADCLLRLGNKLEGIVRLQRALEFIAVDDGLTWLKARELMWDAVGFNAR